MALVTGQPLRWVLVSMLVAGAWAIPHAARACSCAERLSPTDALSRADVVFEGRVIHVPTRTDFARAFGGVVTYEFEVERYWKGAVESNVSVNTPSSGSACGRRFRIGERYLVYAQVDSQTGDMIDTICSRTRESERADEDFTRLPTARRVSSTPPERGSSPDREAPYLEPPPPPLDFPAEDDPPPGCQVVDDQTPTALAGLVLLGLLSSRRRARSIAT